MNKQFSKLEDFTEVNLNLIDEEAAKTQLKSMKLGYIQHIFVLKDMEKEYNRFHEMNLKKYTPATLEQAETHALKQISDPNYYNGEAMKKTPTDVAQAFQAMLMLRNKKEEIDAKRSDLDIVTKNIKWLTELLDSFPQEEITK